jgi:hypothetical protein
MHVEYVLFVHAWCYISVVVKEVYTHMSVVLLSSTVIEFVIVLWIFVGSLMKQKILVFRILVVRLGDIIHQLINSSCPRRVLILRGLLRQLSGPSTGTLRFS